MKVNRYYHTNLLFYNLRTLKLEDLINLKTIMIMYKAKIIYYVLNIFKGYFRLYKINTMKQDKQDNSHCNIIEQILNQCQYQCMV